MTNNSPAHTRNEGLAFTVAFAGQSNMLGHSRSVCGTKPSNSKIYVWRTDGDQPEWATAGLGAPPFNVTPDMPNNAALHFADRLQKTTGGTVYLIGHAVNASTLLSWSSAHAQNMSHLLKLVRDAFASPALKDAGLTCLDALLWHQGESDDIEATMVSDEKCATLVKYSREFHKMAELLTEQPWWNDDTTALIAGELIKNGWLSARNDFYSAPEEWQDIANMSVASSDSLEDIGDNAHFSGKSLQELGERMFRHFANKRSTANKLHRGIHYIG